MTPLKKSIEHSTCKDCIHDQVCSRRAVIDGDKAYDNFKDRTRFIEVPDMPKAKFNVGDICLYGFGSENKSRAMVQIVDILNDERGVAKLKFLKVWVDDTGNGFFRYLLKTGSTMNGSFKYLQRIDHDDADEQEDNDYVVLSANNFDFNIDVVQGPTTKVNAFKKMSELYNEEMKRMEQDPDGSMLSKYECALSETGATITYRDGDIVYYSIAKVVSKAN